MENWDGVVMVIPGHAADLRAVPQRDGDALVSIHDAGAGLQQRFPQLRHRAQRADVCKVGADEAAAAADHVAARAASLAEKDGVAPFRIPRSLAFPLLGSQLT